VENGEHCVEFDSALTRRWNSDIVGIYFPSVSGSFFTMLQMIAGRGSKAFQHVLSPMSLQTPGLVIILIIFFFIMRYGVLNIVLGVIVSKTLKTERNRASAVVEKLQEEQLKILYSLKSFFMACDLDGNGELDKEEMRGAFSNVPIMRAWRQLDVPVQDSDELFEFLDLDRGGSVSFDEFIQGVMRLKSTAKEKDVATLFAQMNGNELSGEDLVERGKKLIGATRSLQTELEKAVDVLEDLAEHGDDAVMRIRRSGASGVYEEVKPSLGARIGAPVFGRIIDEAPRPPVPQL